MSHKEPKKRIVIIGGGFGGVKAALELSKEPAYSVTVVSDRPDFWYYPTFYHTATGGVRAQSNIPLRNLLAAKPIEFIQGHAETLDRTNKNIILDNKQSIPYDSLILALGVVTNYFGITGLAEFSYGIKSISEVEELKAHLHRQITDEKKPDLNYVIVGGGATGVELAGSLGPYLHRIMKLHGVRDRTVHIDLVEGERHLMPRMPKSTGRAIEKRLRKLGIRLYLGKTVAGETADELTVGTKPIRSHTVIWTAGQANNPFFSTNGFVVGPHHKVVVDEFLRAEKDIYVIGDNADTPYSGMAQTALYDAEFVAHNFYKEQRLEPKLAYRPKKPIYVIPAGPRWAAVEWGKMHIYGWLGWFLREAGDFVAFTDIEPLHEAAEQWARSLQHQDLCPICGAAA